MANRYSYFRSTYRKPRLHQRTKKGNIFERDWVTTNGLSVLAFGEGRKPLYNSGNFVFTTSNVPSYHKKHNLATTTDEFRYDDCKGADDSVNSIDLSYKTIDLRDYAYYGSCLELIRATIEHIVATFPGQIKSSGVPFYEPSDDVENPVGTAKGGNVLNNQFAINLYDKEQILGEYDNPLRFFANSYESYEISVNGGEFAPVTSFSATPATDLECYDERYRKFSTIKINAITIEAWYADRNIVYTCAQNITIKPKEEIIEAYFDSLKGLEKLLLNRGSKPLYRNIFITPIEEDLRPYLIQRFYTWPSDGYCIDVQSFAYEDFIEELVKIAMKFDETWCDNIYRSMAHEAIKNFDWAYSDENAIELEGGERMKNILRITGRVFDDVKRYIDGIKKSNALTYDSNGNMSNGFVSDTLEEHGIDVFSTIFGDDVDAYLTKEYLKSEELKWYQSANCENTTPQSCDVEFMRRLALSAKRIMQTKGTRHSIDMIMGMFGFGDDDYKLIEKAYYVTPIRYDKKVEIDGVETELGDAVENANNFKTVERFYDDDPYSGLMLRSVILGFPETVDGKTEHAVYLVPYYDGRQLYDGSVVFQGKGGWMHLPQKDELTTYDYNFGETLTYLKAVPTIGSLMNLNPVMLSEGDVYYVVNIDDYTDYDENPNNYTSHFFYLNNPMMSEDFSSWTNVYMDIKTDGSIEPVSEAEMPDNAADYDEYTEFFEKALYLDSIVSTSVGNNPHTGFGLYDDGKEYLDTVEHPLKRDIDRGVLQDDWGLNDEVKFELQGSTDDKIQIVSREDENKKWYINTKELTIEFDTNIFGGVENMTPMYQYLFKIIMPYLLQVIPSTTILKVVFK